MKQKQFEKLSFDDLFWGTDEEKFCNDEDINELNDDIRQFFGTLNAEISKQEFHAWDHDPDDGKRYTAVVYVHDSDDSAITEFTDREIEKMRKKRVELVIRATPHFKGKGYDVTLYYFARFLDNRRKMK